MCHPVASHAIWWSWVTRYSRRIQKTSTSRIQKWWANSVCTSINVSNGNFRFIIWRTKWTKLAVDNDPHFVNSELANAYANNIKVKNTWEESTSTFHAFARARLPTFSIFVRFFPLVQYAEHRFYTPQRESSMILMLCRATTHAAKRLFCLLKAGKLQRFSFISFDLFIWITSSATGFRLLPRNATEFYSPVA